MNARTSSHSCGRGERMSGWPLPYAPQPRSSGDIPARPRGTLGIGYVRGVAFGVVFGPELLPPSRGCGVVFSSSRSWPAPATADCCDAHANWARPPPLVPPLAVNTTAAAPAPAPASVSSASLSGRGAGLSEEDVILIGYRR